jgi:hypothetical protein
MKAFFRTAVTVLALFAVMVSPSLSQENYLIIKKKDGERQRVPLQFSPEEIESFDVTVTPGSEAGQSPAEPAREEGAPPGRPTHQPQLPPAQEPSSQEPLISPAEEPGQDQRPLGVLPEPRDEPPATRRPPAAVERQPGIMGPDTQPGTQPDRPAPPSPRGQQQPDELVQPFDRGGRATISQAVRAGAFKVNVYELPEKVENLPDYSAFRPAGVITSDSINLDPAQGRSEPQGLPDDTKGLGLRFVGLFRVSGEGIFLWKLHSKDGARLHIDDKTLIENDGVHPPSTKEGYVHLAQGVHSILLDSFNSQGDPVLQVSVVSPDGSEDIFSISKGLEGWTAPEKPYDVLWGQVYFVPKRKYDAPPDFGKLDPIGRLIASELNILGDTGIPGLPGREDMIGIDYEGYFTVKGSGVFAFRLLADAYAELKVGEHTIAELDEGLKGNSDGVLGWAFLQEGSYPLEVKYFHPSGQPRLELFVTEPQGDEKLFAPAQPLAGFPSGEEMSMFPAYIYFVEPESTLAPNFNKMEPSGMLWTRAINYPVDRGTRSFPGLPQREEWFGLRFYVKFNLSDAEKGTYKFRVIADDGARLIVGKKLVINAKGKGVVDKRGAIDLPAGTHEMFLDYFQSTGKNGIQLFITPPGGDERVFAFQ